MSKIIKPFIVAVCFSITAFILFEKFGGSEYAYYVQNYSGPGQRYWKSITEEMYTALNVENLKGPNQYGKFNEIRKEKIPSNKPLFLSIAVAIGSFLLMYKNSKKDE